MFFFFAKGPPYWEGPTCFLLAQGILSYISVFKPPLKPPLDGVVCPFFLGFCVPLVFLYYIFLWGKITQTDSKWGIGQILSGGLALANCLVKGNSSNICPPPPVCTVVCPDSQLFVCPLCLGSSAKGGGHHFFRGKQFRRLRHPPESVFPNPSPTPPQNNGPHTSCFLVHLVQPVHPI